MPAFVWDTEAKFKLLFAVIDITKPPTPNWDQVAEMMGGGVSGNAVRQAYQKIRKEGKFPKSNGTTPTSSPSKPSNSAQKPKLGAGKNLDSARDDTEPPLKRPKLFKSDEDIVKSEQSIKPEPEEEDEVVI